MYVYVCVCGVCSNQFSLSTIWVSDIELKLLGFRGKHLYLLSHPTSSLSWVFRPSHAGRQEPRRADSWGNIIYIS